MDELRRNYNELLQEACRINSNNLQLMTEIEDQKSRDASTLLALKQMRRDYAMTKLSSSVPFTSHDPQIIMPAPYLHDRGRRQRQPRRRSSSNDARLHSCPNSNITFEKAGIEVVSQQQQLHKKKLMTRTMQGGAVEGATKKQQRSKESSIQALLLMKENQDMKIEIEQIKLQMKDLITKSHQNKQHCRDMQTASMQPKLRRQTVREPSHKLAENMYRRNKDNNEGAKFSFDAQVDRKCDKNKVKRKHHHACPLSPTMASSCRLRQLGAQLDLDMKNEQQHVQQPSTNGRSHKREHCDSSSISIAAFSCSTKSMNSSVHDVPRTVQISHSRNAANASSRNHTTMRQYNGTSAGGTRRRTHLELERQVEGERPMLVSFKERQQHHSLPSTTIDRCNDEKSTDHGVESNLLYDCSSSRTVSSLGMSSFGTATCSGIRSEGIQMPTHVLTVKGEIEGRQEDEISSSVGIDRRSPSRYRNGRMKHRARNSNRRTLINPFYRKPNSTSLSTGRRVRISTYSPSLGAIDDQNPTICGVLDNGDRASQLHSSPCNTPSVRSTVRNESNGRQDNKKSHHPVSSYCTRLHSGNSSIADGTISTTTSTSTTAIDVYSARYKCSSKSLASSLSNASTVLEVYNDQDKSKIYVDGHCTIKENKQ